MFPLALARQIENYLHQNVLSTEPVSGGCIHHATKLTTTAGPFFLKWNPSPRPGMFLSEVHGLSLIAAAADIKTPQVFLFADQNITGCPGFILMEWIEPEGLQPDFALLGEKLAALHLSAPQGAEYGLEIDNFIGSTPQENTPSGDWVAFHRDRRLDYQMKLAARNGRLPAARRSKLEYLIGHLDRYLEGIPRRPALIHGDLWTGNVLAGPKSEPCLIDPAVYFGDREAEIAYTELFGGFPPSFYQAYNSTWPLEPGYAQRRAIYNLYHLLNHLNIFGETYGGQIDQILRTLTG